MKSNLNKTTVFRNGSKNFFFASMFFSARVRNDITTLYGFVRVVDDFVDSNPQDIKSFDDFKRHYRAVYDGHDYPSNQYTTIIRDLVQMIKQYSIDPQWIESFFKSMEMDTEPTSYEKEQTLRAYIYGSAEVIGLCIASICALPRSAHHSAQLMGRAFQYINFIRDIKADFQLGRIYLVPQSIPMKEYSRILQTAQPTEAFDIFIRKLIDTYHDWCNASMRDLCYFTYSAHVAIKIAALIFDNIAKKIYNQPSLVLKKKATVSLLHRFILVIRALLAVSIQRLTQSRNTNTA